MTTSRNSRLCHRYENWSARDGTVARMERRDRVDQKDIPRASLLCFGPDDLARRVILVAVMSELQTKQAGGRVTRSLFHVDAVTLFSCPESHKPITPGRGSRSAHLETRASQWVSRVLYTDLRRGLRPTRRTVASGCLEQPRWGSARGGSRFRCSRI